MTTQANIRPANTTDDAGVYGTTFYNDVIRLGSYASLSRRQGVRFIGVNADPGSAVAASKVTWKPANTDSGTTVNVRIWGEASVTPATFSTYADFAGRTRTTAYVDWNNIGAWSTGTYYDTPDIAAIIQEIVSLPGWASGNNIVLFFEDNSSTLNATRRPYDYGATTTNCANLSVTWTAAATGSFIPSIMRTHFIPSQIGGR